MAAPVGLRGPRGGLARRGLDRLANLVRAGDVAGAREAAGTLASSWSVVEKANPEHLLAKALTVEQGLDQPDIATMLLAPFWIEMLERIHAAALAKLAAHYGESWTRDLVGVWFGRNRSPYTSRQPQRTSWLESLPSLCEALRAAPEADVPVGRLLTAAAWAPLRESAAGMLPYHTPSHRDKALGELGPAVAGLLVSTAIVGAADLRAEVVAFLCQDNEDLVVCALSALRAAHKAKWQAHPESGLDLVARHCAAKLEDRVARPARAANEWSIELPEGCRCELCQTLGAFLSDPDRRTFEWPLAEQRRRHVHSRIDQGVLPVRHQTQRRGRPYTLVLGKTDALFAREREARRRDQTDLAWLSRTFAAR